MFYMILQEMTEFVNSVLK